MTPRANILQPVHELAGSATQLATHVGEVIGAAVNDAATVVADTATHVYGTLASTIDEKTGRAPRRRRRGGIVIAVVLLLVGGAVIAKRRRRATDERGGTSGAAGGRSAEGAAGA